MHLPILWQNNQLVSSQANSAKYLICEPFPAFHPAGIQVAFGRAAIQPTRPSAELQFTSGEKGK